MCDKLHYPKDQNTSSEKYNFTNVFGNLTQACCSISLKEINPARFMIKI